MSLLTLERLKALEDLNVVYCFTIEEKNELIRAYREHLQFDTALAQASAFAQYVSDHAKGEMVKAAQRFLSTEGAQYIEKRINVAKMVYEKEISEDLLEAVYQDLPQPVEKWLLRRALQFAFQEMINEP